MASLYKVVQSIKNGNSQLFVMYDTGSASRVSVPSQITYVIAVKPADLDNAFVAMPVYFRYRSYSFTVYPSELVRKDIDELKEAIAEYLNKSPSSIEVVLYLPSFGYTENLYKWTSEAPPEVRCNWINCDPMAYAWFDNDLLLDQKVLNEIVSAASEVLDKVRTVEDAKRLLRKIGAAIEKAVEILLPAAMEMIIIDELYVNGIISGSAYKRKLQKIIDKADRKVKEAVREIIVSD